MTKLCQDAEKMSGHTIEWPKEIRYKAGVFCRELMDLNMREYLQIFLQDMNKTEKISDDEFYHSLCAKGKEKQGQKAAPSILEGNQREQYKGNPFELMDFQAYAKCLRFSAKGREDFLPGSSNGNRIELDYPNRFFEHTQKEDRGRYFNCLKNSIAFRNLLSHVSDRSLKEITPERIRQDINNLKELLEPINRFVKLDQDWNRRNAQWYPIDEFWHEKEELFREQFGTAPIDYYELGKELDLISESEENTEWKVQIRKAIRAAGFETEGHYIIGQENIGVVKSILKKCLADIRNGRSEDAVAAERMKIIASAEIKDAQITKAENTKNEGYPPDWRMNHPEALKYMQKQSRQHFVPGLYYLQALIQNFMIVPDESVLKSATGVEFLKRELYPVLSEQNKRIQLDESVVTTLFSQARNSKPYTDEELAMIQLSSEEELNIDEIQTERKILHQEAKNAIKALLWLKKRDCLTIHSSLTHSPYSYVNIQKTVVSNRKQPFFILTMDKQLARELKGLSTGNAVAAKPTLDGEILLWTPTYSRYKDMISDKGPASPEGDNTQGKSTLPLSHPESRPAQSTVCQSDGKATGLLSSALEKSAEGEADDIPLKCKKIPAERTAVLIDGQKVRLGSEIGAGGEGTIYDIPGDQVVKIYRAQNLRKSRMEKLTAMVERNPQIAGLCWPVALVYNEYHEWVGYSMPKAKGKELATTIFRPGPNCGYLVDEFGWHRYDIIKTAANIAKTFAAMHRQNILMGDINPRNFMINKDHRVFFVDCDSYQFQNYRCPVGQIMYTPPEILKKQEEDKSLRLNYLRTQENELHSLATLLFETIMLGKPPYVSRNRDAQDVKEQIIRGDFPYPLNGEVKNGSRQDAPIGSWRSIWSHTTYEVKKAFFSIFTNEDSARTTAAEWSEILERYCAAIERGYNSNELMPIGYKNVSNGESDTMVEVKCAMCQKAFSISRNHYASKLRAKEPILCNLHESIREAAKNASPATHKQICSICHRKYDVTLIEWLDRQYFGMENPAICPGCTVSVKCDRCGSQFEMERRKQEELRLQNKVILCPNCIRLQNMNG